VLLPASRRSQALTAGVLACGCVVAAWLDPDHPLGIDVCLFQRFTGLPCLTCGLTRALCHALRGNWATSFSYHPTGLLLAVALVGWALWAGTEAALGRRWHDDLGRGLRNQFLGWGMAVSAYTWIARLASGTLL
jgi:hypothetical protein